MTIEIDRQKHWAPSIQTLTFVHFILSIFIAAKFVDIIEQLTSVFGMWAVAEHAVIIGIFGLPVFLAQILLNLVIMAIINSSIIRWMTVVLSSVCLVILESYVLGLFEGTQHLLSSKAGGDFMGAIILIGGTVISGILLLSYIKWRIAFDVCRTRKHANE